MIRRNDMTRTSNYIFKRFSAMALTMALALTLALAVVFMFAACTPTSPSNTPQSNISQNSTPELTAEPSPTVTEVPTQPYKGDGSEYVYIMTDERDRRMEEDIVYFADTYIDPLHGHPLLSDRRTLKEIHNARAFSYSDTEFENFYDEALKTEFVRRINELILGIPTMSDAEIFIGLEETAAILHDVHSLISIPLYEVFHLAVEYFQTDNGNECYITFTEWETEELLLSRLDAINGIPVPEIIERMRGIISYESETFLTYSAYNMLMNCDVLRHIGVMGSEKTAVFTLTDNDGNMYEREVKAVSADTPWNGIAYYYSGTGADESDIGIYLIDSNQSVACWYTLLADGKALYVRFNSCIVDAAIDMLLDEAFAAADEMGVLEKVILDFRKNPGGYTDLYGHFKDLTRTLGKMDVDTYVLIDNGSISAATAVPAMLKRCLDRVTLVGSPSAQPTHFFYRGLFNLPNSGIYCQCSGYFVDFYPGYEEPALQPDVLIYQTIEDYANGIDSVLEYVLAD